MKILCLTGGIGGAKLALGLYRTLPADALTIAVNTGDDFTHFGLEIWPDFDTTLYTLAGLADRERGWGRADETWRFMETLRALGGEDWFNLGDRDLALHVARTEMLKRGTAPADVARALAEKHGVGAALLPATEQKVRTFVETDEGVLSFQDYFVRRRAEPRVTKISYAGAENAAPCTGVLDALADADVVIVAPSNPLLSIGPMLAMPALRAALAAARAPVIAVSPLIGGQAIKGPTTKIMAELGLEPSAVEVARGYADVLDGYVLDEVDAALAPQIEALGLAAHVAQTLMRTDDDKDALARATVNFAGGLRGKTKRSAA